MVLSCVVKDYWFGTDADSSPVKSKEFFFMFDVSINDYDKVMVSKAESSNAYINARKCL